MMTEKQFNNLKQKAIEIWKTYDDTYGYATEKIRMVKSVDIDEWYVIVNMFDPINQHRLIMSVNNDVADVIKSNYKYLDYKGGDDK